MGFDTIRPGNQFKSLTRITSRGVITGGSTHHCPLVTGTHIVASHLYNAITMLSDVRAGNGPLVRIVDGVPEYLASNEEEKRWNYPVVKY